MTQEDWILEKQGFSQIYLTVRQCNMDFESAVVDTISLVEPQR